MLSTAVSATIGVSSLCLAGQAEWSAFGRIWITWWLGDAVSALVVAPFLILWCRDFKFRWRLPVVLEASMMIVVHVALSSLVFGVPFRVRDETYPIPFAFPFLAWVAFRLGPRATVTALVALSVTATWGTLEHRGPFADRGTHESLLLLQIFMAATAATALAVATSVEQRRRAEQQFRDGEERQRLVLESALDAVILMNETGHITDWSSRARDLFGWSREEVLGRHLSETLLPPDHRLAREWNVQGPPGSGPVPALNRRLEFDASTRDGRRIPVEMSLATLSTRDGTRYSAFVSDMSERRRGEEIRARLAAVVESSDDAIITKGLDGVVATWNHGAERMFGWTAQEARGKPITLVIPEELREEEAQIIERLRRGERIEHVETRRRARDGRIIDVSLSISPLRDEAGSVVGASTIARDITARKKAEAAERFLLDASRTLAASLDYDVTLREVVRLAAENMADWCAVDLLDEPGRPIRRVVHHKDPAKLLWADSFNRRYPLDPSDERGAAAVLRTGRSEIYPEITEELLREGAQDEEHLKLLRELAMTSVMIVPLRAGGRVLGALSFVSAESKRRYGDDDLALAESLAHQAALAIENARIFKAKEDFSRVLESEVEERTAALKDALTELEGFSYTVAHDLRAPLRALASFSGILKEEYGHKLDAAGQEYVDRIANAAVRMDALVQDLLAYSRLTRQEVRLETVPPEPLLQEVLAQMEGELRERKARVDVVGPFPPLLAHRVMLGQALANLVGNAVKFVAPGTTPEVGIRAEQRGGVVRIWVSDNGIGVAPEHHERIFEIFERLDPGRFPGTGIGLAIVRKAVERMGGSCGVESAPGEGSRFWIELPRADADTGLVPLLARQRIRPARPAKPDRN
jgi:PAS domain S-box-containing protein